MEMAKISFALVLTLMVALPVLGQDIWESMLHQAKDAGVSSETIDEAKKAVDSGTVGKALGEAKTDSSSWADMVKQKASSLGLGSPAKAPAGEPLLEAEVPSEAPQNSPTEAPSGKAESASDLKGETPKLDI